MTRIAGLRRVFRLSSRRTAEQAVDEEIALHLELLAQELEERGYSPDDAAAEARRRFGDVAAVRARCHALAVQQDHATHRAEAFQMLRQDLAYATRRLERRKTRRRPAMRGMVGRRQARWSTLPTAET